MFLIPDHTSSCVPSATLLNLIQAPSTMIAVIARTTMSDHMRFQHVVRVEQFLVGIPKTISHIVKESGQEK